MAWIEHRGTRYRVCWRDPAGRLHTKHFDRKNEAQRYRRELERDLERGEYVDPRLARLTFGEWADQHARDTVHLKPKTRAGYESLMRAHVLPFFGAYPLGEIRPDHVRSWVKSLDTQGLSASRVRQAYQRVSALMRAAVIARYLGTSPCVGVDLPRLPGGEMRFLDLDELDRLVAATPEPFDVLVEVLAWGGLRWGEAAALRRGRCELLRSRLVVVESLAEVGGHLHFGSTKTYQRRDVVIPASVRDRLAVHLAARVPDDPDALVFSSPLGGPLRHSNFSGRVWTPALRRAGLEGLRIHDLRHTAASLAIAGGVHPKAIQAHLGHSSIVVTMDRYGHLFPDEMDRLGEALEVMRSGAGERSTARTHLPTHPGTGQVVALRPG